MYCWQNWQWEDHSRRCLISSSGPSWREDIVMYVLKLVVLHYAVVVVKLEEYDQHVLCNCAAIEFID